MSNKIRSTLRDPQRNAARITLAVLLGLLAFMLAAAPMGGPLSGIAISQTASPSPSDSPSESPTDGGSPSATGPSVFLINPAESTSTEISAKADGTDSSYHLVARVSAVPNDPSVEFKYADADANETNIGPGTRVGSTDTWEADWSALPTDGTYTLIAILFSGTNEQSRHELEVTVNNEGGAREAPPPLGDEEPQGETVEFMYPDNGGPLGFYTTGVGEDAVTTAIFDVTVSDAVESVTPYYSVSPGGADPEFQECANGAEATDDVADGVPCELDAADALNSVTAVAVVANETDTNSLGLPADPLDDGLDAADAHRVAPYEQVPTSVTINPVIQTQLLVPETVEFPCSQPIAARVLDQNGRKVARANVDVHASGPTDNLFFDDSEDNSSEHQPPDQGGHGTEDAMDCEGAESDPPTAPQPGDSQQGDHEQPTGTPDIKHIESVTPGGTNDAGEFVFQLHSQDDGVTQFTAWADINDSDLKCTTEAQGNGTVGWNQNAPAPTGLPNEEDVCEKPSPSPSPSGSATETPPPGDKCPNHEDEPGNHIVGTEDGERLEGTSGRDVICGLGGDDTIIGLGGNDLLLGGAGNDTIRGRGGDDDIRGGAGKDGIRGNDGDDNIRGGNGNDVILGNVGHDTLIGNNGNDVMRGGDGNDLVKGNSHKDTLQGGNGHDRLRGGSDNDTLRGGRKSDNLRGGKGDDQLRGGKGNDTCNGGPGTDSLSSCEN